MKLTLRRETLASLADDELAGIAGGQTLTGIYPTTPVLWCVPDAVTAITNPCS